MALAPQASRPTAQNLRIRTTNDAHRLFHAVYLNLLPIVIRRLDSTERTLIRSGDVHVWEERDPATEATGLGIERWTDGRLWGPSRVRDGFLFYHEKEREPDTVEYPPRYARMLRTRQSSVDTLSDSTPEIHIYNAHSSTTVDSRPDKLVKQTYSVLVHVPHPHAPNSSITRKWHMTAYFAPVMLTELKTIDDMPTVSSIVPPHGMYEPARSVRARPTRRGTTSSSSAPSIPPSPPSSHSPISPYEFSNGSRSPSQSGYPYYTPFPHQPSVIPSQALNQLPPIIMPSTRAPAHHLSSPLSPDPRMSAQNLLAPLDYLESLRSQNPQTIRDARRPVDEQAVRAFV
ncbi:hypothetical protein SISNIDRAFT_482082 [Sistotremastrum niveocremeum HHB9708]|uniref:Gti1/Pac2 family-domain-containing protein n=2 Tax=Sistotremastraceae TaxID=3402574 RepID=A0A164YQQ8_9AGAM|nr:hypothetical protein SISNIDRAFT_482082 [Sistotremastrum niveocremeum HHB9708]KZT41610.1 hypothetical protein SISSUDRAFT_1059338 [Sistotremastrum suecicum HHB10207 ss-3]